jgi:hypothetical protein
MGCIGFIYEGYDDMTGFFLSVLLDGIRSGFFSNIPAG